MSIGRWLQSWRQTTIANKSIAIASITVAAATVVYAIVSSGQLSALRESNRINREALASVQRAFLSFSGISPGATINSRDWKTRIAQQLILDWYNSGATPAKDVVIKSSKGWLPWPKEPERGFAFPDVNRPDFAPKNGILPPGWPTEKYVHLVVGPHAATSTISAIGADILEDQRSLKSRLFFWGWAVYKDIFPGDPDRLTEFCTEMFDVAVTSGKSISDPSATVTWHTQPCSQHNCYDEDCSDYAERTKVARSEIP